MMNDTLPILYNGGAYGTYLEWCLTTLCSTGDIVEPFTSSGSSHKFNGNAIKYMEGWQEYLDSGIQHQFVRMHPKVIPGKSIQINLDEIAKSVPHFVFLYPDTNSVLLTVNNFYYKIWEDWWYSNITRLGSDHQIYNNWPVDPSTPLSQIPTWIKREFLSLYLMPTWHELNDWYLPDHYQSSQCIWVFISDLLYNFESTLADIVAKTRVSQARPISDLVPYHQTNLALQKYTQQDQICHQIIKATLAGESLTWDPLPLPSESWIQWELRNQGWEIECNGLDIFPGNSLQLQKTLYQL
jgi:hypothetical protein